jgi:hypothetical protein
LGWPRQVWPTDKNLSPCRRQSWPNQSLWVQ